MGGIFAARSDGGVIVAKDNSTSGANSSDEPKKKKVVVEVVCEGFLGTLLLKKGDRTSDPEYVALIDDERNLVKLVK